MTPTTSISGTTSPLSILASSSSTTVPQDIYRVFARDTSLESSLINIGESFVLFGIVLFILTFTARIAMRRPDPATRYMLTKNMAYILTTLGIVIVAAGAYWSSDAIRIPSIFSNTNVSQAVWESYKRQYIDPDSGRTIDPDRAQSTTSEGESYTMLRAVWLDDQETFDQSWQWARSHLQREDRLFSWIYGLRPDGSYGIQTEINGQNSASDADTDIALALIFAYARWQDPQYLADAREIIDAIWKYEVVMIADTPYLAANNIEKSLKKDTIVVNPSYLAPYAYRIFAQVDTTHPWGSLVDSSYELLQESLTSPLDTVHSAEIAPDWIQVHRETGAISALDSPTHTTHSSYDAMRVPWRIALDWQWNKEPRARALLDRMSFFRQEWDTRDMLYASYGHDGSVQSLDEAPAVYGGTIGFFMVSDPQNAREVYREKLLILFDPDTNTWRAPLSYYDANWVWFGMALYNDQLINLSTLLTNV